MKTRPFQRGDRVQIDEAVRESGRSVGRVTRIKGSRYHVAYDDPIPAPPFNHIYTGHFLAKHLTKIS